MECQNSLDIWQLFSNIDSIFRPDSCVECHYAKPVRLVTFTSITAENQNSLDIWQLFSNIDSIFIFGMHVILYSFCTHYADPMPNMRLFIKCAIILNNHDRKLTMEIVSGFFR